MDRILSDFETDSLEDDLTIKSVYCLIKSESATGETVWAARSGGQKMSSEEILGALESLVESIRQDLASDWRW